jgi:hypothetical protein
MDSQKRIKSLIELGRYLSETPLTDIVYRANGKNNWFTVDNVMNSLHAIGTQFLDETKLLNWLSGYDLAKTTSQKVGVVMAGNIPAVGFHDALCVLAAGHKLMAKLSADDTVLMSFLLDKLIEIEPEWANYVQIVERMNDADAVIATGSDNTARYFDYYFAKKPHIIRRNRTSVGVLNGQESSDELAQLGNDVLQYFGLGCRNVSKVYVPVGYEFSPFYESIESLSSIYCNHHKYFNNYEYNRSVLLVNREVHFDNGFLMLRPSQTLVSPISVLFYEEYESTAQLNALIDAQVDKIQCVVSQNGWVANSLPFGQAQTPSLTDYADGVDTMEFLVGL